MIGGRICKIIGSKELKEMVMNSSCKFDLLTGNGFNVALGIDTGYKKIRDEMLRQKGSEWINVIDAKTTDLEQEIKKLEDKKDPLENTDGRHAYLKLFLMSLNKLVKDGIHQVIEKKELSTFMDKFENYYTLNYDHLLLLVLFNAVNIEYTDIDEKDLNSIIESRNTYISDVHMAVKNTPQYFQEDYLSKQFPNLKKNYIQRIIGYLKDSGKSVKMVDTGFLKNDKEKMVFSKENKINFFPLHGLMHIVYENDEAIMLRKKFSTISDKIQDSLEKDNLKNLLIFQGENKLDSIKENEYLNHCYESLCQTKNDLVVIGCSFNQNDFHILKAINQSGIQNIYINVYRPNDEPIIGDKEKEILSKLTGKNVYFFKTKGGELFE